MGKRELSVSLSSDDFRSLLGSSSDSDDGGRNEKRHRSEKKSKKDKSDKKEKKDKSDKKEKKDKADKKEKKDKKERERLAAAPATVPSSASGVKPPNTPAPPPPAYGTAVGGAKLAPPATASATRKTAAGVPAPSLKPPTASAATEVIPPPPPSAMKAVVTIPAAAAPPPAAGAAAALLMGAGSLGLVVSPTPEVAPAAAAEKKAVAAVPPTTASSSVSSASPASPLTTKTTTAASAPKNAAPTAPVITSPTPIITPAALLTPGAGGALFAAPPPLGAAPTTTTNGPTLVPPAETLEIDGTIIAPINIATLTTANNKVLGGASILGLNAPSLMVPSPGMGVLGGIPTLVPPTTISALKPITPLAGAADEADSDEAKKEAAAPIVVKEDDFSTLVAPSQVAPIVLEAESEEDYVFTPSSASATATGGANKKGAASATSADDDNAAKMMLPPSLPSAASANKAATTTTTTVTAAPPTYSDDDDDIDINWGGDSDEDEDEAEALAAFDRMTARVKQTVSRSDDDTRKLLSDDRAAKEAAAAAANATALTIIDSANSFANAPGGGQLTMVWADDEAEATDDIALKLKIPPTDKESKAKIKKMHYVNHNLMKYKPIETNFYIPPSDVASLTEDEIRKLRKELDGAQVKGKDCPRPMKTWRGIGLKGEIVALLHEKGFNTPFAMQSLAMPVLMSGRDLVSIAKTGSGKTLAYALPLIRHVVNQPRPGKKGGPLALVLLPTHILAQQVYNVIIDFAKASGLRVIAAFGGTDLRTNIDQCVAGCDIMIATPGRLLDLCTINSKGVVSLPDCSFVVIDEADRMFDAGFREHVTAFLRNCRPDKQLAFISATMCKEVKAVIKSFLKKDYIELSTGGKPAPSTNVNQTFDFFDQQVYEADVTKREVDKRLVRLLEILSEEWTSHLELDASALAPNSNNNNMSDAPAFVPPLFLIFVDRKSDCDYLAAKLQEMGFRGKVGVLNSDYDMEEMDVTITRFNPHDRPILIATGSAERGLDVYGLDIVINYWMPDHYEAYVHRVGRTGRAGKRGRSISFFIKGKDDPLAEQLLEGLERCNANIPEQLTEAYLAHRERVRNGEYTGPSNFKKGFGSGKSYKFASKHEKQKLREDLKACGLGDYLSSDDSDVSEADSDYEVSGKVYDPEIIDVAEQQSASGTDGGAPQQQQSNALVAYKGGVVALSSATSAAIEAAKNFAAMSTAMHDDTATEIRLYQSDYVINNLPQHERLALMRATFLQDLQERTNTTITKKGEFVDKRSARGQKLSSGVKPLYLEIRGETRESLTKVFRAFEEVQKEARRKTMSIHSGVVKNVQF